MFFKLNKNPIQLFILSQALLLLTFVMRDTPVFAFVAFAPLFALIDHRSALKDAYLPFIAALMTAFIFYYSMQESMAQSSILSWIIYFLFLAIVFTMFSFLQFWTDGRLNKFALVIFILAMEYILVNLMVEPAPAFLADLLKYQPAWTRWNVYTGYTGASLWILLINLLVYQTLFSREKINIGSGVAAIILTTIPLVYSLSLEGTPIDKSDVLALYGGTGELDSEYKERGEFISRTGAWVSALIVIFTIIIGVTKKKSR